MPHQHLLVVDCETTGLFPESGDVLLEVGVGLVDASTLELIDETSVVIGGEHAPVDIDFRLSCDPTGWVRRTHTDSGLLAEVEASDLTLARAETQLLEWLSGRDLARGPRSLGPMVGSSVHFDQRFLRREMPTVLDLFSHRLIDVSSTREQARLWRPDLTAGEPTAQEKHRVLPDIHDTLVLLRYYREHLFATPGEQWARAISRAFSGFSLPARPVTDQ